MRDSWTKTEACVAMVLLALVVGVVAGFVHLVRHPPRVRIEATSADDVDPIVWFLIFQSINN